MPTYYKKPERSWSPSAARCPRCGTPLLVSILPQTNALHAVRCKTCRRTINVTQLTATLSKLALAKLTPQTALRLLNELTKLVWPPPKQPSRPPRHAYETPRRTKRY